MSILISQWSETQAERCGLWKEQHHCNNCDCYYCRQWALGVDLRAETSSQTLYYKRSHQAGALEVSPVVSFAVFMNRTKIKFNGSQIDKHSAWRDGSWVDVVIAKS